MDMHFGAGPNTFKKAQELRNNETNAEKLLWQQLSENKLGVKFRRQHPLKYFIIDFYCHSAKLVIELDGGIHNLKVQKEYDKQRELEIKQLGLTILRFSNDMVENNIDEVLNVIRLHLGTQPRP